MIWYKYVQFQTPNWKGDQNGFDKYTFNQIANMDQSLLNNLDVFSN